MIKLNDFIIIKCQQSNRIEKKFFFCSYRKVANDDDDDRHK